MTAAVIGIDPQSGLDYPVLKYDAGRHLLYVGIRSRDPARRNLLIYSVGQDGRVSGLPFRFPDHPDPLVKPFSGIRAIGLDTGRWPQKLYLGLQVDNQPDFSTPFVIYDLDARGMPIGSPRAFAIGYSTGGGTNPAGCCDIAFHPTQPRLYTVGYGFTGFATFSLSVTTGEPTADAAISYINGNQGKASVRTTPDGTKLCLGAFPSRVEIVSLDSAGDPVSPVLDHKLPQGDDHVDVYLRLTVANDAVYYVSQKGLLGYFRFDSPEDPTLTGQVVRGLAPDLSRTGNLLAGFDHYFRDVLTGISRIDGTEINEVPLVAHGVPGTPVGAGQVVPGSDFFALSALPDPAFAGSNRNEIPSFVGNRISGLGLRVSADLLTATGTFSLDATVFSKLSVLDGYLTFVYSGTYGSIYFQSGPDAISALLLASPMTQGVSAAVSCPGMTGILVVDEINKTLYAACNNGTVAAFGLNATGIPVEPSKTVLRTGLGQIVAMCLGSGNGKIYAVGPQSDTGHPDPKIIPVYSSQIMDIQDIAFDASRGHLYACTRHHKHQNVWVWEFDSNGQPTAHTYDDGLPVGDSNDSSQVYSLRIDSHRRKLYLGGYRESGSEAASGIIVYDLDVAGFPAGSPGFYATGNITNRVRAIELSVNKRQLYASGSGDTTIFTWALDADGKPNGTPQAGSFGGHGKWQLRATTDGAELLAGSYPATLERIRLLHDERLRAGAPATLSLPAPYNEQIELDRERKPPEALVNIDIGVIAPDLGPSQQIDLDPHLRGRAGTATVTLTLSGLAPLAVTDALVHFDVSRPVLSGPLTPVNTFRIAARIHGNQAALLLPFYGSAEEANLHSQIQGATEHYAIYRDRAAGVTRSLAPLDYPKRTIIASGLIGLDATPESLAAGLDALLTLGHNTITPRFAALPSREVATMINERGFHHFRHGVYIVPGEVFDTALVNSIALETWINGQVHEVKQNGADPTHVVLFHLGDESGWYYPDSIEHVKIKPDLLEAFQKYLRDAKLPLALFGKTSWGQLQPAQLSKARTPDATPEDKALVYWTVRFFTESFSLGLAQVTQALCHRFNKDLLTTVNPNFPGSSPSRFIIPSPDKHIANSTDPPGPDTAMGTPDWFDLGRKRGVTCLWTEDWFGDRAAERWSFHGDILRCAALNGAIKFGGDIVGKTIADQPEGVPDGASFKVMALAGRGAAAIDFYTFGQPLIFSDSWSDYLQVYGPIARALWLLGRAETLFGAVGTARRGPVAILFPQASQIWDPGSDEYRYSAELRGLHAALTHDQYTVDFVDDSDIEGGALADRSYNNLYVTAPNLSEEAQNKILQWVSAGGTLVLLPGAARADRYDHPIDLLSKAAGVSAATVARERPLNGSELMAKPAQRINRADPLFPVSSTITRDQTIQLGPTAEAKVLATFDNGDPAVVVQSVGQHQGQIVSLAYWPGLTYWMSADLIAFPNLYQPYFPQGWSADARQVVALGARLSGAARHAELMRNVTTGHGNLPLARVPVAGIEVLVMDAPSGIMVTLLAWYGAEKAPFNLIIHHPLRFFPGQTTHTTVTSVKHGLLQAQIASTSIEVTLPALDSVDVVVVRWN